MIIIQLFFGVSITLFTYALPSDALAYVDPFSSGSEKLTDMESLGNNLEEKMSEEMSIGFVDMATLVFYSGNVVVDLIINSILAVPIMLDILIGGLLMFISINAFYAATIKLFFFVFFGIMYLIAVLGFISDIRAGSSITGVI